MVKKAPQGKRLGKAIGQFDPSDLKSDYDFWPVLASKAWTNGVSGKITEQIGTVLFAGMGGSGIVGALACDYATESKSSVQFSHFNDYHLPPAMVNKTLVVAISSSGNTEETLSAMSDAHSRGIALASFGSGGFLEEYSVRWDSYFTRTTMLKVPRSSLPGLFFPVLRFLSFNNLLTVPEASVSETIEEMRKVEKLCSDDSSRNPSFQIAEKIVSSPAPILIYSSGRTQSVGLRFRQSLNENAKLHAFNGRVPEICHNDIVGWDASVTVSPRKNEKTPIVFMLRLEDELEEVKVRFDILQNLIRRRGGRYLDVPSFGKSYLSRIFSMLYLLDYATYYAAILRRINPMATPSIDLLKRELATTLNFVSHLK